MIQTYSVINSGGSAVLNNRKLTVAGSGEGSCELEFLNIKSAKKVVSTPEVLGQATVSFVPGNNTTYSFTIQQEVEGRTIIVPMSYTSDATGTEGEIDAAFGAILNQLISAGNLKVSFSVAGANTIVITALAGFPKLIVSAGANTTVGSVTPGKEAVNTLAKLVEAGIEGATEASYTSYTFVHGITSLGAGAERVITSTHTLYAATGDASIAALDAILAQALLADVTNALEAAQ